MGGAAGQSPLTSLSCPVQPFHTPLLPLEACAVPYNPFIPPVGGRQVELSFITGAGSDEVRRLLLALQQISSPARDGAVDTGSVAMGRAYLSGIERLGQLYVREDWLREQLA